MKKIILLLMLVLLATTVYAKSVTIYEHENELMIRASVNGFHISAKIPKSHFSKTISDVKSEFLKYNYIRWIVKYPQITPTTTTTTTSTTSTTKPTTTSTSTTKKPTTTTTTTGGISPTTIKK